MDIITRIFDALKASGKSQNEFAAYLGVPKSLITHWKSGRINSYTKYMPKIAEQIVSYHYAYDTAPGTAVEMASNYANAVSSIYTRIVGSYESAYNVKRQNQSK